MAKQTKKILVVLLSVLMLFSVVSTMNVFAADSKEFSIEYYNDNHIHDYSKVTVVEPTCETSGYTEYECSECGDTYKVNKTDPLGHWLVRIEVIEPTCVSVGRTEGRYCSRCNTVFIESREIPKIDHDIMVYERVAPTCTEEGRTEGKQCRFCGEIFEKIESIPPTGHYYVETVIQPATCATDGLSHFQCKNCYYTYTGTIPAKGHDYDTEWTIDVQETCTESGMKSRHCKVCDERTDITVINALGGEHKWNSDWTIDMVPTHDTAGLKSIRCAVCGAIKESQTIPAIHEAVAYPDVAPTCTMDGSTGGTYCYYCGQILTQPEVVPKTGHHYKETVIKPSCETDGVSIFKCKNCDDSFTVEYVAKGHTDKDNDGKCDSCGVDIETQKPTEPNEPDTPNETTKTSFFGKIKNFLQGIINRIKNLFKIF